MFKDLYAVARHTPLNLIITPNGEQLCVIVMPKPTGEAGNNQALTRNFKIAGTPEELVTEFPAALAKYSAAVNELRGSLDLPLDALEEAKKKAAKKDAAKVDKEKQKADEAKTRSEAAKKGAATRAAQAAEKKKARAAKDVERKRVREIALQKRRDATAARKAAKPASKIKLPGATTEQPPKHAAEAKPAATSARAAARHLASKPGKSECIADYVALQAKVKEPLTRRGFIKRASTGRRYEKLWESWTAFVAEASAGGSARTEHRIPDPEAAGSNPAQRTIPIKEVVVPPLEKDAAWPFPTDDDNAPHLGEATDGFNHVFDESGTYLSSITTHPKVGEHISLVSQKYLLRATSINRRNDLGLDVIVTPDQDETGRRAEAIAESVRAAAKPKFEVRTEDGELLYTYRSQPEIGERLEIPGRPDARYRVLEVDGNQVIAREVLLGRMKILDPEGVDLQVDTDQVYSIGDRVVELETGDWRVVVVTGAYYMARRTDKPRVKGPAATAAPATEGAATA